MDDLPLDSPGRIAAELDINLDLRVQTSTDTTASQDPS